MSFGIMNWERCEREFVKRVEVDLDRVESIKEKAMKRLERARAEKREIDFAVEDYYEVVKELLTAYLLKNGFRSKNHQCLISYFLRENPDYEREAYLVQQMSYFRNKLNYYGESVPREFYDENREGFEKIIKLILGLICDE